jgi:hypothetical protein
VWQIRSDNRFEKYPKGFRYSGYIMRTPTELECNASPSRTGYYSSQREQSISLLQVGIDSIILKRPFDCKQDD